MDAISIPRPRSLPHAMLHEKDDIRDSLLDDIYACHDMAVSMPRFKMPEKEHAAQHVCRLILDELMLDGNSRQNLATFCRHGWSPRSRDHGSASTRT